MQAHRSMRFVACLAIANTGCALIFTDGPPPAHTLMPYFDCSSDRGAPAADTTMAALTTLMLMSIKGTSSADWKRDNPGVSKSEIAVPFGILAAVSTGSAIYGYWKVDQCRDAKDQLARRLLLRTSSGPVTPAPAVWPPVGAPVPGSPVPPPPAPPESTPPSGPTPPLASPPIAPPPPVPSSPPPSEPTPAR